MKKMDLSAGHLGNGITVWDRSVEVRGDYKHIAHIDSNRKVTWYVKNPPKEALDYVQGIVDGENPSVSTSQPDQKVFADKKGNIEGQLKHDVRIKFSINDPNIQKIAKELRAINIDFEMGGKSLTAKFKADPNNKARTKSLVAIIEMAKTYEMY